MGTYAYCRKCDRPLPSPWQLGTDVLLAALVLDGFSLICKDCGEPSYGPYQNKEPIIDALAERIDCKNV